MTTAPSVEDIAELRKQGDFRAFLKMHVAATVTPGATPAPAAQYDPGHRPGAWPTGTRPPVATTVGTPEQWAQAVTAYRHWLAAGQPPGDFTCECGCIPRRPR